MTATKPPPPPPPRKPASPPPAPRPKAPPLARTLAQRTLEPPPKGEGPGLGLLLFLAVAITGGYVGYARHISGPGFLLFFGIVGTIAYLVTLPCDAFIQISTLVLVEGLGVARIVDGTMHGLRKFDFLIWLMVIAAGAFLMGKSDGSGGGGSSWSLGCGSGCASSCGGGCGGGCGGCGG